MQSTGFGAVTVAIAVGLVYLTAAGTMSTVRHARHGRDAAAVTVPVLKAVAGTREADCLSRAAPWLP